MCGLWGDFPSSEPGKPRSVSHTLSCTVLSEWSLCVCLSEVHRAPPWMELAGVALHEQINVPFFAVLNLEALGGGEQGVATGPGIRQAGSCLVPVQMDQADMWVVWPDWLGESRVWLVRVEAVTLTLCRWGPSMLTLPPALSLVLVSADCGISIIESRPPNRTLASLQALRRCQEQGHSLRVSQQCCSLGRG